MLENTEQFLTPIQAAAYLNVSVGTLAVWRSTGRYPELRFVRVGCAIRYRKSDVDSFVESRLSRA
jgi:excisionase family DNA binding protein